MNIELELIKDNPRVQKVLLKVFSDAVKMYREALVNIKENGAICKHPRTGSPIENPYLKISEKYGAILVKMSNTNKIKSDRVLDMLEKADK